MNLNPLLTQFDRTSARLRAALEQAIETRNLKQASQMLDALEAALEAAKA